MYVIKQDCCPCDCRPRVIGSFTTNRDNPTWDLTPYQGDGVGILCGKWRLYETGGRVTYRSGDIDEMGRLLGLPSSFTSGYYYNGYMELQQGCCPNGKACADCYSSEISWP